MSDREGQSGHAIAPVAAAEDQLAGACIVRAFLAESPFVGHLGIQVQELESDRAVLRLPFSQPVVTIADVVHGGAVGALADTAAMTASWATADPPAGARGTTVGLSIDFLAAARSRDLIATALVLRRGSSLCFCDVEVAEDDGRLVAKALVTYKLG